MEVFCIAALSANGKIAEQQDQVSLDWTSKEDLKFFIEKTKEAGALVMGRKTYETIGKPLKGRLNVIMTRSASDQEGIEGELVWTSETPVKILDDLKAKGFEKVAIAGGGEIYSLFLKEGLVTDLYLTFEPVLFGNGTHFANGFDRLDLELIETKPMGEQAIMCHYKVK